MVTGLEVVGVVLVRRVGRGIVDGEAAPELLVIDQVLVCRQSQRIHQWQHRKLFVLQTNPKIR